MESGEVSVRINSKGHIEIIDPASAANRQSAPVDRYEILRMDGEDYEEMRNEIGDEMYQFIRQIHDNPPDIMVFLDKSARPAYWFFDSLWEEVYPEEEHPEVKFINIGTEKQSNHDQAFERLFDREAYKAGIRANETQVEKVREHFRVKNSPSDSPRYHLSVDDTIMIVDEYSSTGETLDKAQALFEAAFGSRYFDNIKTASIFSQEPPWISSDPDFNTDSFGVRDGKPGDYAIRPMKPIPFAVLQLKHEMKMLAEETARKKLNR